MQTTITAVVFVAALALQSPGAAAMKKFVALIPNGINVPQTPAIGHSDGEGFSSVRNAFGDAFADAGKKWTLGLCQADTDRDGQTNGQELGDPCCEWTVGAAPRWSSGVSHPSDATKTSNASLWANIDCSNVTKIASTSGASSSSRTATIVSIAAVGVAFLLNFV